MKDSWVHHYGRGCFWVRWDSCHREPRDAAYTSLFRGEEAHFWSLPEVDGPFWRYLFGVHVPLRWSNVVGRGWVNSSRERVEHISLEAGLVRGAAIWVEKATYVALQDRNRRVLVLSRTAGPEAWFPALERVSSEFLSMCAEVDEARGSFLGVLRQRVVAL